MNFFLQEATKDFYRTYNGAPFNSLEPEFVCQLVFVSRVEILSENEDTRNPPPGHTELPTCPVCLERMDESVDGILTILCNHSFHSNCLQKWGDSRWLLRYNFIVKFSIKFKLTVFILKFVSAVQFADTYRRQRSSQIINVSNATRLIVYGFV